MNITGLFSFYISVAQSRYVPVEINREISHSILEVIDTYMGKYSSARTFDLIISCSKRDNLFYFEDLTSILFGYWSTVKIQTISLETGDGIGNFNLGEQSFNLVFVDGWSAFVNINPALKVKNYDINEYYYIILQDYDIYLPENIRRIFEYCWQNFMINVTILIQKASGDLIIYTYFPFTKSHCGKAEPVEISRYENGKLRNPVIFPDKTRNMHQCPLRITFWDLPPFISIDPQKTGEDAIVGLDGEILKAMANNMNFKIDYNIRSRYDRTEENRTKITIHLHRSREVDMTIGFRRLTIRKARALTATNTYYFSPQVVIVLRNSEHYLAPELLSYPFSPAIWMILVATITMALLFIVSAFTFAQRKSLIVHAPPLKSFFINFVALTLGMTSLITPKSYFGRFLLIIWALSTMVIRVQYQSMLFHLIRNNYFKGPPTTIDELLAEDYTFVMAQFTRDWVKDVPIFNSTNIKIRLLFAESLESVFIHLIEHPEEKLAALVPKDFLIYYETKHHKVGLFFVLQETILLYSACFYLTKHSYLITRLNSLLSWMDAFGLIGNWATSIMDLKYFKVPPEVTYGTIGLKDLVGLFGVCCALLTLSIIIFILEVLSVKFAKLKHIMDRI